VFLLLKFSVCGASFAMPRVQSPQNQCMDSSGSGRYAVIFAP
jgi:hypothetical protein